jgi:hypothetical protein
MNTTFFYNVAQIINEIMRDRFSRNIKGEEARLLRSVAGELIPEIPLTAPPDQRIRARSAGLINNAHLQYSAPIYNLWHFTLIIQLRTCSHFASELAFGKG